MLTDTCRIYSADFAVSGSGRPPILAVSSRAIAREEVSSIIRGKQWQLGLGLAGADTHVYRCPVVRSVVAFVIELNVEASLRIGTGV